MRTRCPYCQHMMRIGTDDLGFHMPCEKCSEPFVAADARYSSMESKVDPQKLIESLAFKDHVFCFTGTFSDMERKDIIPLVEGRGGTVSSRMTMSVHYLVFGTGGSRGFKYETFGTKYVQALKYLKKGIGNIIAVIPEEAFLDVIEV